MLACTVVLSLIPVFEVSAGSPTLSASNPVTSRDAAPGEILVKFKPRVGVASVQSANNRVGAQKTNEIKKLGIQQVKLPPGMRVSEAIAKYKKMADVEYAEPNYVRKAFAVTPNDPYYSQQWGLNNINAPGAWDTTTGNPNVVIAIIDTGVDYNHEDLAGKVILGPNYVNTDSAGNPTYDPIDDNGHGTEVAGIAAAVTNNSIGIAGVSWGSKILAIKALDKSGTGYDSDIAKGIVYAADHGAKIINLSLGGPNNSRVLADAIEYAHENNCVITAAGGNEAQSGNTVEYPAAYPGVIAVAATGSNNDWASYSNYKWYIDVAAPGGDGYPNDSSHGILSCYPDYLGPKYLSDQGTSMATPFVSGLVALVAAEYPDRTADQITRSIEELSTDLGTPGRDDYFGYGLINAQKTVGQNINSKEDADASIAYTGNWSSYSSTHASGGEYKSSSTAGSSAVYSFYGTGVTWVAKKSPSSGIAKVYIDGGLEGNIDLYSQNDIWQYLAYKIDGLTLGMHTIKIEVTGTNNANPSGTEVNIDALDMFTPIIPLYRLYNKYSGDHFYTTSSDEVIFAENVAGYTYEGIAAYIW